MPFGYGACEHNLDLPGRHAREGVDLCAFGKCASDQGWPPHLVRNGDRQAVAASADGPNRKDKSPNSNSELARRCATASEESLKARSSLPGECGWFSARVLAVLGALDTNKIRNYGEVYRLFWASLLHSGWIHLLLNVVCLGAVLMVVEPVRRFLASLVFARELAPALGLS